MNRLLLALGAWTLLAFGTPWNGGSPAHGQSPDAPPPDDVVPGDDAPPPPREGRRPRGGRGDRDARRREWRNQYREATPEQQRDMRADRQMSMLTRLYDLDESQQAVVKAELTRIADERRAAMGPDAAEIERLNQQVFENRPRRGRGGPGGPPDGEGGGPGADAESQAEWQAARERLRELRRKHEGDRDADMARIEALLPPDQVAKGRERREQWEQRRREMEEQRAADGGRPGRRGGRGPRGEGSTGRGRRPGPDAAGGMEPPPGGQGAAAPSDAGAKHPRRRGARNAPPDEAGVAGAPAVSTAAHPWSDYTARFITEHRLTPEQANSALGMLDEMQARESALLREQARQRDEAERTTDPAVRAKRLAELREPQNRMFEELKARLNGLLTAEQRRGSAPLGGPTGGGS